MAWVDVNGRKVAYRRLPEGIPEDEAVPAENKRCSWLVPADGSGPVFACDDSCRRVGEYSGYT